MELERLMPVLKDLGNNLSGKFYFDESPLHQTILRAYSTDASVYQEKPLAVCIAKNKQDIQLLIRFAKENSLSLIPRAAGTSLAGQVVGNGIVVDISKYFNRILELNTQEKWVKVEPGVIRDDLNAYLKPFGLMFGPETSTASRAMIGGMIGNNSSGLHSIVWGDTRSQLISANVILDDGEEVEFKELTTEELEAKKKLKGKEGVVYRELYSLLNENTTKQAIEDGYPKKNITRRNTGYALDLLLQQDEKHNLCTLLAGSEGTLGFITEAKLQLIPLPKPEIGIVCIHCNSVVEAMHANLVALSHFPESSELVDKYILDFTKDHPTYKYNRFFIEGDPQALLMVEFAADSLDEIQQKAHILIENLKENEFGYAFPLVTGEKTKLVWDVRKAGLGLIRNLPGDTQPVNLIEDCAVAPEDLPQYVEDIQKILDSHNLNASYYAHAGAGELHIEPLINLKTEEGKKAFRNVLAETAVLLKKYKGSLSGEHGDGRLRGEFIPVVLGEEVNALLIRVKQIFDTNSVFNAGKIVNTPPMDEFLRYSHKNLIPKIETLFDFTHQEGILKLAEKCSGSGDCRKTHISGGTMCPSYMATREEKDTTRARANLLRQFLSNPKDKFPFNHPEIKEAMQLCLSCKACKSECPSGVDVAKMKAEFLQHYYDKNGVPFRSWVIGNFTKSQQMASWVPGIYNYIINQPFLSGIVKSVLGFAKNRTLPEVGNVRFSKWLKKEIKKDQSYAAKAEVVLFCDEFTEFNDLSIGKTTYKLLEGLGYKVIIQPHSESGRTYLSKGLLRKAQKIAIENVNKLGDFIHQDRPLIGIEPSAILTFRDEYIDLVPPELKEKAKNLAKNALTIEEFLAREIDKGLILPEQFQVRQQKIKLHGHCYQKAFHLVGFTEKILSFPQGHEVELIPSGCCGMAGSFGYEKENYPISMDVAELVLLPEIRKTDEKVLIAAPGTSCRHQIKDGVNRKAWHPVEILYKSLIINSNYGSKIKKT